VSFHVKQVVEQSASDLAGNFDINNFHRERLTVRTPGMHAAYPLLDGLDIFFCRLTGQDFVWQANSD